MVGLLAARYPGPSTSAADPGDGRSRAVSQATRSAASKRTAGSGRLEARSQRSPTLVAGTM